LRQSNYKIRVRPKFQGAKNMKRLAFLLVMLAAAAMLTGTAIADDISFSGGVKITQGGSLGSPAVNFTFSGLSVTPGTLGGDSLEGAGVAITPATAFSFTSIVGSTGLFSPNTGTLTIGNGTTGTVSGTIDFVNIVSGGTGGSFAISINLSNLTYTSGTSAVLNSWAGNTNGNGALTFQFTTGGGAGLNDLLNLNLGTGALGNTAQLNTSVSGSVSTPEPASLFLLGTGLMTGGGLLRRKILG